MEEDNVAIRLKGFIDSQGLTNSQFADQCRIPRPSLSQIISGRNKNIRRDKSDRFTRPSRCCRCCGCCLGEGNMIVDLPADSAGGDREPNLFTDTLDLSGNGSKPEKYANVNALTQGFADYPKYCQ